MINYKIKIRVNLFQCSNTISTKKIRKINHIMKIIYFIKNSRNKESASVLYRLVHHVNAKTYSLELKFIRMLNFAAQLFKKLLKLLILSRNLWHLHFHKISQQMANGWNKKQ